MNAILTTIALPSWSTSSTRPERGIKTSSARSDMEPTVDIALEAGHLDVRVRAL